ncbi:MAG: hypothetical protein ACXAC6_01095 [Candidatus Hodarchaeales archaeon]|jgi:hypothetical protein
MFVCFILAFCLWTVLCLYRNSDGFYFKWRDPPKLLISPMILILSLLSTLLPDFHQPAGLMNESRWNFLPLSYPFGVNYFTSQNFRMTNWHIWFFTPDLGLTLTFPGYFPFNMSLVNLVISLFFFLVNYFFTIIILTKISSYLIDSEN